MVWGVPYDRIRKKTRVFGMFSLALIDFLSKCEESMCFLRILIKHHEKHVVFHRFPFIFIGICGILVQFGSALGQKTWV